MKYGELTTGCIIEYKSYYMSYMCLIVDVRISVSNMITAHCLCQDGTLELWCSGRNLNEDIMFNHFNIL